MTECQNRFLDKLYFDLENSRISLTRGQEKLELFQKRKPLSYYDYSLAEERVIYFGNRALIYPVASKVRNYIDYMFILVITDDYNRRHHVRLLNHEMVIMLVDNGDINIKQYDFLKKALESIIEN